MLKKIIAGAVLALGLVAVAAAPAQAADPIVITPSQWVQVDNCGTANDTWELVRPADYIARSEAAFVTKENYTDPAANFLGFVQAKTGYVYPDGTRQVIQTFAPFTDVPCEEVAAKQSGKQHGKK